MKPNQFIVVGPSWPFRSGIARYTTALAKSLKKRNLLAAFLVPFSQYPGFLFPGKIDKDKAACEQLEYAETCYAALEPWTWEKVVQRIKPTSHTLLMPYWTSAGSPFQSYLSHRCKRPFFSLIHNFQDHEKHSLSKTATLMALRKSSFFFCHTLETRRNIKRVFPKIPVGYAPLPALRTVESGPLRQIRNDKTLSILFFGLIRTYKGLDILVEAVARLPLEVPVRLFIVGEPWNPSKETITRWLLDPRLKNRVVAQLSWISEPEIAYWFSKADVLVLPYRSSDGSAVAALAMQFGLPVIATKVAGLEEVVQNEKNGLLVPANDVEELKKALLKLRDKNLQAKLTAGMKQSAQTHSWEKYVDSLLRLSNEEIL